MYNFKILDFEGPLDLLLHLIKQEEMDIMDIEIVTLTNQYLAYIENMESLNIVVASEYLTLASELIYLKSRYLLPKEKEADEDEEFISAKENLINRLIEYKNYKEMTGVFKNLEEKRKEVFTKVPSSLKEFETGEVKVSPDITLDDLLQAFSKYLERKKYLEPLSTKVTTKEMSVEERSHEIRTLLKEQGKVEFFDLFENISKPYVVITFLSILEMAKNKELVITQENNFDKIYCEVA